MLNKIMSFIGYLATATGLLLGSIQLYDLWFPKVKIPIFNDTILVSSPISGAKDNQSFIDFLDKHTNQTVFISLDIDLSYLSFGEQKKFWETDDYSDLSNLQKPVLPLPVNTVPANYYFKLSLLNNNKLLMRRPGPDFEETSFKGAFDITLEYPSAHHYIYHLQERVIPYEEERRIDEVLEAQNKDKEEEFQKVLHQKYIVCLDKSTWNRESYVKTSDGILWKKIFDGEVRSKVDGKLEKITNRQKIDGMFKSLGISDKYSMDKEGTLLKKVKLCQS